MFGYLHGTITFQDDPHVFIEVNGIGYKVFATREVFMMNTDDPVKIYTYTYVREDTLELFGFAQYEDLKLFEQLITVSGIGPKTAVQIFSVGSRKDILDAIINGNVEFFTATPRLGKKNAQKIIIELRNKFTSSKDLELPASASNREVISALESIGFTSQEIQHALSTIDVSSLSTEEQIKTILQHLGK